MARIYISSTLTDLREFRVEVYKAIRRLGHLSVAMEDWAASDLPPLEERLRAVRESDVVIVLVAWRYGYIPNGDGSFQSPVNQGIGTHAQYVVAGDFNGDGKLDLVVEGNYIYNLLGKGDGTFQPARKISTAGSSVRIGDFNGDGKLDLGVFNNGTITILLGNGNGTFQTGKTYGKDSWGSGQQRISMAIRNSTSWPSPGPASPFSWATGMERSNRRLTTR